jgi:hypothetical protein
VEPGVKGTEGVRRGATETGRTWIEVHGMGKKEKKIYDHATIERKREPRGINQEPGK